MKNAVHWCLVRCCMIAVLCISFGNLGSAYADVHRGYYDEPGIYPNRAYIGDQYFERIDPFNGGVQQQYVDLFLPGNGKFDLKLIRTYNSAAIAPMAPLNFYSQSGIGWDIHFGRVATKNTASGVCRNSSSTTSSDNPVLITPDGARQIWYYPGNTPFANNVLTTPQRWRLVCGDIPKGVTVYSPEGIRYDMAQLVIGGGDLAGTSIWLTTRITDPNGNYATINYVAASSPQISSVVTNDGRSFTFSYSNGLIASITSNAGQTVTYSYQSVKYYNASSYLLSNVRLPDSTNWSYTYKTTATTDITRFGLFQIATLTTPQGGKVNYGYSLVDFYSSGVSNPTNITSSALTSKTTSDGGSWTYSYSPSKSAGTYDVTTEVSPAGTTTYYHYGYQTVANGNVWMIGLLASKSIGSAQSETYSWSKRLLSNENMVRPSIYGMKYDQGASNAPILTGKTIERNGASHSTTYSNFDTYDNPRSISESGPNGGSRSTSISYYINTTKWIINQPQNEFSAGSSISREFDANGNLTSLTQDGVTTSFGYDAQGNITSEIKPGGLMYSYGNYKRGIPQTESQPESISISRVVSDAGNVTSETNGEGKTKTFLYDTMNRVTRISFPVGSQVSISYTATSKTATRGTLTESTAYDGFGRPTSVTLGGITRTYRYDALGRKIFESDPGVSTGTSYQYDILNRVTRVTNADGTYQNRSYGAGTMSVTDERGKVTMYAYRAYGDPDKQFLMSITAPDASANVAIARNSKDLVISITQGGLTRTYGYNANYYLTSVTNPETQTTTYGRDAAGNMTSRAVGASGTSTYTYDGQNRLTKVVYPGATPSVTQTYSKTHKLKSVVSSTASRGYVYDANDNLTSESVVVDGITLTTGYGYNALDQLTSLTYPYSGRTVTYSPDVLGRPTAVSGYVSAVAYWPSGQVKQINYANGTISTYGQNSRLWPSSFATQLDTTFHNNVSYTYDGVGNLTAISDSTDANYNRTLGYDNINRLVTANGPWGNGAITYNGVGNVLSQVFGASSLYYTYDAKNRLTNVSGERSGGYAYDAYGNIVTAPGSTYAYDGVPNLRCANCGTASEVAYAYDGLNQRILVTKGRSRTYEVYGSHGNLLLEYTPGQGNKLTEYIYLGGKRIAQRETHQ